MGLFSSTKEEKTKSTKLKEEGCVVTLKVEIPPSKFQEATQNMLVRLQGQAKVPGFRPGKAPLEVVEKHFAGAAKEKALDQLIRDSLNAALQEHRLQPISTPAVHSIEMNTGKPLVFEVDIETPPNFKPKDYKKLPVTRKRYPATDQDISQRLEELREGNARLEKASDEVVGKAHYVVLDYEGRAEGKPMPGAKGTDQLLDMSSPGSVEGLSEGLLGAKRGESREIAVKVGGKPATFQCNVKEIKNKILPSVDDEFAKDLGYASLAELKEQLKSLIEEEGRRKSERELIEQLEQGLLKNHKFPVPPSLVSHETERLLERLRTQLLGARRDWPEGEKDKLREKLKPKAEDDIRLSYLLQAIADAEKIEVTDADLDAEKARNLESAQDEDEKKQVQELFEERGEAVKGMLRERKVMELLKNSAAVTEA